VANRTEGEPRRRRLKPFAGPVPADSEGSIGVELAANVLLRKLSQNALRSPFGRRPVRPLQTRMAEGIGGNARKQTETAGTALFSFAERESRVVRRLREPDPDRSRDGEGLQ
jgi:hypothetical protein